MIFSNKFSKHIPILRIFRFIQTIAAVSAVVLGFFMFLPMPALVTLAQERKGMNAQKISVTLVYFGQLAI